MKRNLDHMIRQLAERQDGAFSRRQVIELGGSHSAIMRRLKNGAWLRGTQTTYTLAGAPRTWDQRVRIAALDRPAGIISGSTAAVLHGIPEYSRSTPEITIPYGGNNRSSAFIIRRCRHFEDIETITIAGIRTMSVQDTVFDLARRVGPERLKRTIEDIVVRRIATLAELETASERRAESNCPSFTRVAAALNTLNGSVAESELERAFTRTVRRAGLPPMLQQVAAPWWEGGPLRVDFVIPKWKLIIELDGRSWHSREQDFERDRHRDNQAAAVGWHVLRFTHRMLTADPDAVVETIRRAGEAAA